jgi:hypothetical protein
MVQGCYNTCRDGSGLLHMRGWFRAAIYVEMVSTAKHMGKGQCWNTCGMFQGCNICGGWFRAITHVVMVQGCYLCGDGSGLLHMR